MLIFLGLICLLENIFLENTFLTFSCLVTMWKTNKQKKIQFLIKEKYKL
jgi:hypothetical protein